MVLLHLLASAAVGWSSVFQIQDDLRLWSVEYGYRGLRKATSRIRNYGMRGHARFLRDMGLCLAAKSLKR